ncbi:Galactitol-1-phosphate 5-dehydrogenase [compost metagenome]
MVAVAVHCMQLLDIRQEMKSRLAVIGDGPLALIAIQVAKAFGIKHVTLFGKHESRLKLALSLGANEAYSVFDEAKIKEQENSYSYVVESVGGRQAETIQTCIKLAISGAHIAVLGVYDFNYLGPIYLRNLFYKEIKLIGSNSYSIWNNNKEFNKALDLIVKGLVNVKPLISHKLALKEFHSALDRIKTNRGEKPLKIIFDPTLE